MIKIGMLGGAMSYHGRAFACILNGCDVKKWEAAGLWHPQRRIQGAKVIKVWDANEEDARRLAKLCYIDKVEKTTENMLEGVDAVILPDDGTMRHQRLAKPFLEARIPLFIDKPLSDNIGEAEDIVSTARENDVPLMSCSALRYARELEEARKDIENIGTILTGSAVGPGDLIYYWIHPLELAYTVMGPGIESVQNVGKTDRNIVRIAYRDRRSLVLQVFKGIAYVFHLTLYGEKGWKGITVKDSAYFYWNMLNHFLQMVNERRPPFPMEHTLEIIKTLASAKESLETGKEIFLS